MLLLSIQEVPGNWHECQLSPRRSAGRAKEESTKGCISAGPPAFRNALAITKFLHLGVWLHIGADDLQEEHLEKQVGNYQIVLFLRFINFEQNPLSIHTSSHDERGGGKLGGGVPFW